MMKGVPAQYKMLPMSLQDAISAENYERVMKERVDSYDESKRKSAVLVLFYPGEYLPPFGSQCSWLMADLQVKMGNQSFVCSNDRNTMAAFLDKYHFLVGSVRIKWSCCDSNE